MQRAPWLTKGVKRQKVSNQEEVQSRKHHLLSPVSARQHQSIMDILNLDDACLFHGAPQF